MLQMKEMILAAETTEKAPKAKAKKVIAEDDDTENEAVAKKSKAKTKKVVADEEE